MNIENSETPTVDLPIEEYSKYIATLAAERVDEQVKKRELRWRYITAAVLAVLAVFGYNNLSGMRDDVRELVRSDLTLKLEGEISDYFSVNRDVLVGDQFSKLQNEIDSRIALLQFMRVVDFIKQGDGFTNEQRDSANTLLRKVAKSNEMRTSAQFVSALEGLLDSYASADLMEQIDSIESELSEVAHKSMGITLTMFSHYGLRVCGEASPSGETVKRFEKYGSSLGLHGGRSTVAAFELMRAYAENGKCDLVERYWIDLFSLNDPKGARQALSVFNQFESWMENPVDPKTRRAGEHYKNFAAEYEENIRRLEAQVADESGGDLFRLLQELDMNRQEGAED